MQTDDPIPWLTHPKQLCEACGGMADYMTLGHMYRVGCNSCGKEELGTFSPQIDPDLPPARPFDVFIDCSSVEASAKNMFVLSKLHRSLQHLKPIELKELIVSGRQHFVGQLYLEELEVLQNAAAGSRFRVVANESEPVPRA